jgi:hypothetical protein
MSSRSKYIALVIAVVTLTSGVIIQGQPQAGQSTKRAIEGSWRVSGNLGPNRPPTAPATVEGLVTYSSGGGFVFTDNTPTSAHGSWEYAGGGRFNATFVRFILNPEGQIVATLHVRSRIKLNFTNDETTSEEEVEIRQFPSGNLLAAYNGATSVARRIRVEPIE